MAKKTQRTVADPARPTVVPGPRKQRASGPPAPQFTTHKKRAAWFQSRAAYPVREADVARLTGERRKFAAAAGAGAPHWEQAGPTNIGGRMTSLAVHPANPDLLYIGAAGGGVWKSEDAGRSWTSLWHAEASLNVGSLAIDPRNPDVIFCGTGEANGSADSYAGVGLYRSNNAGKTWKLLAASAKAGIPRRIGVIAIDPSDSNHIRIGGVRHSSQEVSGMFVSRDGGTSWARDTQISPLDNWCHAIVFHPSAKGVLFATVYEQGARNGIWRSDDSGASWKQLAKGLPEPAAMNRTSLALAPSSPDTMYAISADGQEGVLGVFRSTDRGESWKSIGGTHFQREGQMSYGNCIAVHPANPQHVLCGGVDLHLTTDGGKTWRYATRWDADRGKPRYAHADHHALAMPAAAPGRVYDANDGGMDCSADGGATWTNRSNGLAATMFYDLDVSQTDGNMYGGGAQDNGTIITADGNAGNFSDILGGDGGWMIIDPRDASHVFASYYNFNIFRLRDGKWADVTPSMHEAEHNSVWMVYITIDPNDSRTFYTASQRVWKTTNDARTWKPVSGVLDGTPISAIEVAPANSKLVYVGTEKGGFYRSTDGGATWSGNLAGTILPGTIVTRIETHPKNARTVLVTVGGTGTSHLFRSDDAGANWADADGGKLPDAPHHAIVIRPDAPDTIFVAGDAGLFQSLDFGKTWASYGGDLPNTMFVDLVYQQKEKTLTVATYGRSLWRTLLS
ncbi:MAG: hypothetical protein LAP87_29330 [Acidobacteriia bacterium]|nr:hypothetical protein [Terriglobia bacterium]